MPIGIDRFESAATLGAATSDRVLRFLYRHADQAFTRAEIADAVDASPGTVGTNLSRLKDAGLVRHRAPYWAALDNPATARSLLEDRYDAETADRLLADSPHMAAARAFVDRVSSSLDEAVSDLYLFGSVATGDETADSDVDVLVVVRDDQQFATVDDRLLEIAYDVQLKYGVPVEVHTLREQAFRARADRGEPFVTTVLEQGHTDV